MSGHNKWSTIKHKTGRADAARGKLFTKLIRELTVASREGGSDADGNPRLRAAINAARSSNMPNDTITRAVKRGAGELEGETYDEILYEGHGKKGVAFLVETLTTNRNRTVAEIRHIFTKYGGELGTSGSVAWMFEQKGYIEVEEEGVDFDELFEAAAELGAEEVEPGEEVFEVTCEYQDLHEVSKGLSAANFSLRTVKVVRIPNNPMKVEGKVAEHTFKLLGLLDDQDDAQNIWTNAEFSDMEMERLSAL